MEVNCRLSSLATANAAEVAKAVKVPKEKTKACMAGSGKAAEDSPSRLDVSLCVSDAPGLVTRVRIAASLPSHARGVVVTIRIPCTPSQICLSASDVHCERKTEPEGCIGHSYVERR